MKTYDPAKNTVVVGGDTLVGIISIKAGRNEDGYKVRVGLRGEYARTKNSNRSGRFEIVLMQESPSNDILSARAQDDEDDGSGVVATTIKDLSGTAVASAAESWIVKPADLERSAESGDVTWIIEAGLIQVQQGGTTDIPGA